jgi:hypothetical protein
MVLQVLFAACAFVAACAIGVLGIVVALDKIIRR